MEGECRPKVFLNWVQIINVFVTTGLELIHLTVMGNWEQTTDQSEEREDQVLNLAHYGYSSCVL